MAREVETTIRFPAEAARVILYHPEFRFLSCAARLHGDWVTRKSDGQMFYELHDPHPNDASEFIAFANRVAGNLLAELRP